MDEQSSGPEFTRQREIREFAHDMKGYDGYLIILQKTETGKQKRY